MSKNGSTIKYDPSSSIMINGFDKAGVDIKAGGTTGYYNMNDSEKQAYDYAQNSFALNLPDINVFDENTQNQLNSQVDAYINAGVEDINEIYDPMLQSLQEDVASRFGNLDNSVFLDGLSSVEDKRSDAVSDLSQSAQIYKQDIVNNELDNRYQYLDYLNNYTQQVVNNMLNSLNFGLSASNSSTNHYNSLNKNVDNGFGMDDILNITKTAANIVL